jgi:hypothetical protein
MLMAKVTSPLHASEARGRVGGIIYNTHRGLAVVKAKTAGAQPRSQLQLQIRAYAITLARLWQSLSVGERAQWNAYAVSHTEVDWTGNPVRLSGLNWYLRLNTRQMHAANATSDTPPASPAPTAVAAFAAADGVGSSVVTWTSPADADMNVTLYLQGPHSAGAIGSLPRARFRINTNANAATVTLSALPVGFYTVWARMFNTTNGLVSTWVSDTFTIS